MAEYSINISRTQSYQLTDNPSAIPERVTCEKGDQVEEITTTAGWLNLQSEWDELLEKSDATVFQSFEWLSTWWEYFGNGGKPWVLTVREKGKLVGILPLYVQEISILHVVAARRVQFIGHGLSDYLMPIIVRGREIEISQLFMSYLEAKADRWDVLDFEDINEDSAFTKWLLCENRESRLKFIVRLGLICPRKQLSTDWCDFLHSLGPNGRSNYKRKLKRLSSEFGMELEQVREPGPAVESAVETFAQIHGGRWKAVGYPSAFDNCHHRNFHVAVSQKLAQKGRLWMFVLKAQGMPVAVCYNFAFRNNIYMYQCNAHGPAEVMKASPGFIVQGLVMEQGISEGFVTFDFLRGDEAYKIDEWKSIPSQNYFVRVLSPTVQSLVRRKAFLFPMEFLQKGHTRMRNEHFEYRRFVRTKSPSGADKAMFVVRRIMLVVRLVKDYLVRHT